MWSTNTSTTRLTYKDAVSLGQINEGLTLPGTLCSSWTFQSWPHALRCLRGKLDVAQFLGFSELATSNINTAATVGGAFGLVLGGVSGDLLARRFPIAARPATNQARLLRIFDVAVCDGQL